MNLASLRPAKAELRNWVAAGINRNRDGRERRERRGQRRLDRSIYATAPGARHNLPVARIAPGPIASW
ncbi:MAG: hypothetical protein ACLPZ0_14055 [Steroidobacteraceae bacterium]